MVEGQFFAVTLSASIEAVEGKMFADQGAAVLTDLEVRAIVSQLAEGFALDIP
jgi:hypothetical protein